MVYENREYRSKQRMNVGRMERIGWLERGFGKMSKRAKPFEYKGKKKPVHPENHSGETGYHHKFGGGGGN